MRQKTDVLFNFIGKQELRKEQHLSTWFVCMGGKYPHLSFSFFVPDMTTHHNYGPHEKNKQKNKNQTGKTNKIPLKPTNKQKIQTKNVIVLFPVQLLPQCVYAVFEEIGS